MERVYPVRVNWQLIITDLELAGVTLEDIELLVDRRELVVRGERTFPRREGRVYQQVEMDYGQFERRVRLMVDVDPEVTTATFEAGVLEVRLRLTERAAARKIDIQSGGGDE